MATLALTDLTEFVKSTSSNVRSDSSILSASFLRSGLRVVFLISSSRTDSGLP